MAPEDPSLRIGVYMIGAVQLLDVASVDIFSCLSREYLQDTPMPQPVKDLAIEVTIKYITPTAPSSPDYISPVTAQTALKVHHSIKDSEVQPGSLDVLMVPGPPPSKQYSEEELDFIRRHWNHGSGATIISVCTGIYPVAAAGVCDGRSVTGPRGLMSELKSKYPKASSNGMQLVSSSTCILALS